MDAETIGITIAPEPEIFDISAPSYRCSGEQVMVHLNGSRSGQTYRLLRNNQFTGMSRQGTGATLDFLVEEGGNYQIQAVSNTSGCQQMMAGIAVITDADIPLADAGLIGRFLPVHHSLSRAWPKAEVVITNSTGTRNPCF